MLLQQQQAFSPVDPNKMLSSAWTRSKTTKGLDKMRFVRGEKQEVRRRVEPYLVVAGKEEINNGEKKAVSAAEVMASDEDGGVNNKAGRIITTRMMVAAFNR